MGNSSGYNVVKYFILDITDMNNIVFHLLTDENFINANIMPNVYLFNNQTCFFVSKRINDYNGEYYFAPHYILNNKLVEMTFAKDNLYRVYYTYFIKPQTKIKINKITFKKNISKFNTLTVSKLFKLA